MTIPARIPSVLSFLLKAKHRVWTAKLWCFIQKRKKGGECCYIVDYCCNSGLAYVNAVTDHCCSDILSAPRVQC